MGVSVPVVVSATETVVEFEAGSRVVIATVVADIEVTVTGPTVVILGVNVVKGNVVGARVSTKFVVMVSMRVKVSVVRAVTKLWLSDAEDTTRRSRAGAASRVGWMP